MEDVLLIYFEQIVSFCAINYSNTNSLSLHCEISRLNLANFTERLIFCVNLLDILPKKYFTQVSLVTNSMSARTLLSFCKCSLFTLHTKAQISIFGQPDSFVWCSDEGFNSSSEDIVTSNEERRGELFAANRGSRLVKPGRRSSKTGRGALHAWT